MSAARPQKDENVPATLIGSASTAGSTDVPAWEGLYKPRAVSKFPTSKGWVFAQPGLRI